MLAQARNNASRNSRRRMRGFSLIEMAMVLLVLGLILGGMLTALGASDAAKRRADAAATLQQISDALYGFAQANGRLPCPATDVSAGDEAPAAGGNCTSYAGFVPGRKLGLQGSFNANGLLEDPWGNPYRYMVANKPVSGVNAMTSAAQFRQWFATTPPLGGGWLCVATALNCGSGVLSDTVPAIVYSMGPDFGLAATGLQAENVGATMGASAYPVANDVQFVDLAPADRPATFDDQLTWLSINILTTRMIEAGKLP